jgi:hypothetical protein
MFTIMTPLKCSLNASHHVFSPFFNRHVDTASIKKTLTCVYVTGAAWWSFGGMGSIPLKYSEYFIRIEDPKTCYVKKIPT